MGTIVNILRKNQCVRVYNKDISLILKPEMLLEPTANKFVRVIDVLITKPISATRFIDYEWEVKI